MNNLIEDLIKKGMGNFMDRNRDTLAWADETYLNDLKCRILKDDFRDSRKQALFCCPKTSHNERSDQKWKMIQFYIMRCKKTAEQVIREIKKEYKDDGCIVLP